MAPNQGRCILIMGAGGHAQVMADILRQAAAQGEEIEPGSFLDDAPGRRGAVIQGLVAIEDSATGMPARSLRPRVLAADEV